MNQAQAVEKALRAFPQIYYFVPVIKGFEVAILTPKTKSKSKRSRTKKIQIKKPLDAILWMIDSLCGSGKSFCPQSQVKHLVSRWTNVNFNKEIGKLYEAKLIEGRDDPNNRQKRQLKLTSKGQKTLARIKDQRKEVIRLLFDGNRLEPKDIEEIALSIERLAAATWPIMNQSSDS